MVGDGVFWFFLGGLCFYVWSWIEGKKLSTLTTAAMLLSGWMVFLAANHLTANLRKPIIYLLYTATALPRWLNIHGKDPVGFLLLSFSADYFMAALFVSLLMTLPLIEARVGRAGKALAILGQISYSTYLLQFPLQIAFAGGARALGIPNTAFYSPIALLSFFAILIPLAVLSYRYFEFPAQQFLRGTLLGTGLGERRNLVVSEARRNGSAPSMIEGPQQRNSEAQIPNA